jgi:pimeloyl-ACP methyl ester carboxylesterase
VQVWDLDATVRFSTVRLASGPTLRYAAQGEAAGEAVLFLHGWPDSWLSFSRLLPFVPPRYRAIVPDQRGFGESDRPDSGYDISNMAADAIDLLDALAVDRATVVGHSFGSFVARRLALARPDRVARLVLIGTGLTADNAVTRDVYAELLNLTDPVPPDFARAFQASTIFQPVPGEFFEGLIAESLKLPARLWKTLLERVMAYDDRHEVARIAAPTLIIWGDRDALFPRPDQDALAAAIPGARLVVYHETGHCPNWERPHRVATDVVEFMGGA